jgi:HlyD family secretion protein
VIIWLLLKNPADFNDVIKLRTLLDSIKDIVLYPDSVQFVDFQENLTLGECSIPFSAFLKAYHSFRSFNQLNYSQRLTLSLNLQIMDYNSQNHSARVKRFHCFRMNCGLLKVRKNEIIILFDKGIISKSAYEKFESAVTEKQIAIEEAQSQINNLRLRISELEQRKLDLDISGKENKNQYFTELITAYQNLTGEIDKWMMNYVLTAPVDGTITFTTIGMRIKMWHQGRLFLILSRKEKKN